MKHCSHCVTSQQNRKIKFQTETLPTGVKNPCYGRTRHPNCARASDTVSRPCGVIELAAR